MTTSHQNVSRASWLTHPDLRVFLALAALALCVFAAMDYANALGLEEWSYTFAAYSLKITSYFDLRPFRMLFIYLAANTTGPGPMSFFGWYLGLKLITGFLLYKTVLLFFPRSRAFAMATGMVFLVHVVSDVTLLSPIYMVMFTSDALLVLLALYFLFRFMLGDHWWHLVPAFIVAVVAIQQYETTFAVLFSAPVAVFLVRRQFDRRQIITLAGWSAVLIAALGPILILPMLGLSPANYSSGQVASYQIQPAGLISAMLLQFKHAFADPYLLRRADLTTNNLIALLAASVALLGLSMAPRDAVSEHEAASEGRAPDTLRYAAALIVAALSTAAGIAPYLITAWARLLERVHVLALPAEALVITAAIWLGASLVNREQPRRWLQMAGVVLIVALASAQVGRIQRGYDNMGASWQRQAGFLRTLVNQAPAVQPNTLFIYVESPDAPFEVPAAYLDEVPFVRAWAFENAIRLFYDDAMTGVTTSEYPYNHFHLWEIREDGIHIGPEEQILGSPLVYEAFYGWDEVIVVTRDLYSGEAIILDTLPAALAPGDVTELYDPYARIEQGFVDGTVIKLAPPYLDSRYLCGQ